MSNLVSTQAFSVENYLEQRRTMPAFTMVEIGHGHCPVIGIQPNGFRGQQAYIGIEAGMRTLADNQAAQTAQFRTRYASQNAFFLLHDIGEGKMVWPNPYSDEEQYHGEYNTQTILPDNAADEVFVSNVFCDPLIARDFGRTMLLLNEVSRLVDNSGTIIMRETITPWEVGAVVPEVLDAVGLQQVGTVTPSDGKDWRTLERTYGCEHDSRPHHKSYYKFLGKQFAA